MEGENQEPQDRYGQIIEKVFFAHYTEGAREVAFRRDEFAEAARRLGVEVPRNLGDIVYSFRYRRPLPDAIRQLAPSGQEWVIRARGRGLYVFALAAVLDLTPSPALVRTKIPDSTPGFIVKYALDDEQALLARLRYNRLLDVFLCIVCYSLQNHLRTTVPGIGQVETDEIYIGVDRSGAHYVVPVQAKARRERLGVLQVEQDFSLCRHRFPTLQCIPVGAQFMEDDVIALFAFERTDEGIGVFLEKHYRLVPPEEVSDADIATYASRPQA
jgi:hypothetical protein